MRESRLLFPGGMMTENILQTKSNAVRDNIQEHGHKHIPELREQQVAPPYSVRLRLLLLSVLQAAEFENNSALRLLKDECTD